MPQLSRRTLVVCCALVIALQFTAALLVNGRPAWGDEAHFVDTVRYFASQGVSFDTLRHYPEMSGPLPFVVYAGWSKLAGDSLGALRWLAPLLALATYATLFAWLRRAAGSERLAAGLTALVALNPYMLGLSMFVFTDMLTMFCLAVGLWGLERRSAWLLFAGAAGTLLCRQYLIYFSVGAVVFLAARWYRERSTSDIRQLFAVAAAHVPLACLFWLWGGPCPESELREIYLSEPLRFHPSSLTLYLALLPIYLAPLCWLVRREVYSRWALAVSAAIGVSWYIVFPVSASPTAVSGNHIYVGFVHRALVAIGGNAFAHVALAGALCLALPLLVAGLRASYRAWKQSSAGLTPAYAVIAALFCLVQPCSYLAWEKYVLPALPIMAICLWQISAKAAVVATSRPAETMKDRHFARAA